MRKIKEWINTFTIFVLIKLFKVEEEFLSPLSWKVVENYDMLSLVTNKNVLCLKSSAAMNFVPVIKDYPISKGFDIHMYKDKSELIFLFDGKIFQTTNNNLKRTGLIHDFKFDLITLHDKFVTKFIKKVILYKTVWLLSIAKEFNMENPVKKDRNPYPYDTDLPDLNSYIKQEVVSGESRTTNSFSPSNYKN